MSEYLGEEAVRAHEARIEALSQMFEDEELQGKEMSAAMREFDSRIFTHRLYHEAPNDVFELIFPPLSDVDENGNGEGGFNVMRLVSKRCMHVVESVTNRLTGGWAVDTLSIFDLKRCRRIEHIRCEYLGSLEGCPDGLKSLYIGDGRSLQSLEPLSACKGMDTHEIRTAHLISDLSPLSSCTRLKKLTLGGSKIADLTPLSSLLLLEELDLRNGEIKDISTISQCKKVKMLNVGYNPGIKDLSPLCKCPDLEELIIYYLPLIEDLSFFEKGFPKLRVLDIGYLPVDDLSPLTKHQSLEELDCYGIPPTTSLLPLARCYELKRLFCPDESMDLNELEQRRPDIHIQINERPDILF